MVGFKDGLEERKAAGGVYGNIYGNSSKAGILFLFFKSDSKDFVMFGSDRIEICGLVGFQ